MKLPPRNVARRASYVICLAAGLALASGCGGGDDDNKPASAEAAGASGSAAVGKQAGFASGRITMPDGKPITAPGASIAISINGVSEAGERVHYSPVIKPDGTYKQKLAPGAYAFSTGSVEVDYEGQHYRFALDPVGSDYKKNRESAEGITQDFVWRTTGEKPGSDHNVNNHTNWFGGSVGVRFNGWRNDINKAPTAPPDGTPITFTLKPTMPKLVDGSDARTITVERKFSAQWGQCDALNDIPPAHYELTGVAKLPDGTTKPLLFEVEYAKFKPVQPVKFGPDLIMNHVTTVLTAWVVE
jgi:hypothetical protein